MGLTLLTAWQGAKRRLDAAGLAGPVIDARLLVEAAADLGCRPLRTFFTVTLPLCWQGAAAGALLVFIPAAGEFVIPDLLGGPDTLMAGRILWTEFFINRDWPMAGALTVAMLVLLLLPILVFQRFGMERERP